MVDTIISVAIVAGALLGFRDGVFRKLAGLGGTLAGIGLGLWFRADIGHWLVDSFGFDEAAAPSIAFLLVFLLTQTAVAVVYKFTVKDEHKFGITGRSAGALLGVIQSMIVVSTLLMMTALYGWPSKKDTADSSLYRTIVNIAPRIFDQAGMVIQELKTEPPSVDVPEPIKKIPAQIDTLKDRATQKLRSADEKVRRRTPSK